MVFNLVFPNNTILSCSFFFFFSIDIKFLIPVVISHIFNPTAGLVLTIGITAKETKTEIEIHPVTADAKIRKCSM